MRILSLFSGYGGLDTAVVNLTGGHVVAFVENDPSASRILAHHHPDTPNLGDVTAVEWANWTGTEIITAGFPCQGISNAGKRKGMADDRSGLWSHVVEAVGAVRPRYVFLENVASLRGRGLDRVTGDLATVGYDLRWTSVRASEAVDAAHHRDRWFGLATQSSG
jgi:DNA (cytosine-5)-methyltransferase 1